jgi:hypothetical protein
MENITVELNGIKYLLVEILTTSRNSNKLTDKCKKYECIYQGVKDVNTGGFWGSPHAIVKILVPEKNIIMFNNED